MLIYFRHPQCRFQKTFFCLTFIREILYTCHWDPSNTLPVTAHEVSWFFVGLAKERECPIIEVSFFKPWSATRMSHNRCFVFGRVEHNPSEAHWNDLRQFDNRSGFSFLHVPPNRHFLSLNPFVSECFETLNNVEILAARNQNFLKILNQINLLDSLVLVRCTYTAMYINGNDRNIMFLGTLFVEKR